MYEGIGKAGICRPKMTVPQLGAFGCFIFKSRGVDALRSRACSITFFVQVDSTRWPRPFHLVEGVRSAGDSSERSVAR